MHSTVCCSARYALVMFGHELDPHQSPRERAARESLQRACRRERDRPVDGADRHDQSRARVRGPRGWHVPDLAHAAATREERDDRAHRVPGRFVKPFRSSAMKRSSSRPADPALRGEMTITITLTDANGAPKCAPCMTDYRVACRPPTTRRAGDRRSRSSPRSSRRPRISIVRVILVARG